MGESTLRWPTDKEREEMEEVCSIGEVPHVGYWWSIDAVAVVFVRALLQLFIHEHTAAGGGYQQSRNYS